MMLICANIWSFVYICIGEWCSVVGDNGGNDCIYDVGE